MAEKSQLTIAEDFDLDAHLASRAEERVTRPGNELRLKKLEIQTRIENLTSEQLEVVGQLLDEFEQLSEGPRG